LTFMFYTFMKVCIARKIRQPIPSNDKRHWFV
jgi:hypothetical protein